MKNQKGFSLIELLVVVIIIAIIAAIAIPSLLASRRAANESSALATLRTINSAQMTYQATAGNRTNFAADGPALFGQGLLDSLFNNATPSKSGYDYTIVGTNGPGAEHCASADPSSASTGTNYFGVSNENGGVVVTDAAATLGCNAGTLQGAGAPGTPVE